MAEPTPKNAKRDRLPQIGIRLEENDYATLKSLAQQEKTSVTAMARQCVIVGIKAKNEGLNRCCKD